MYQRFLEINEKITCQIGLEFQVSTAWAKGRRKMICFETLTHFVQSITFIWKGSRWFDHLIAAAIGQVVEYCRLLFILAIIHLGCRKPFANSRRAFIPGGATPYFRRQEYGRLPWPIPFLKSCCIRNRTLTLRLAGGRLSFVKETKHPMDGFQKQSFNKALYWENRCQNSWKTILVCNRTWIDKNYESNQTVDFKSKRCCLDLHVPGEAFPCILVGATAAMHESSRSAHLFFFDGVESHGGKIIFKKLKVESFGFGEKWGLGSPMPSIAASFWSTSLFWNISLSSISQPSHTP